MTARERSRRPASQVNVGARPKIRAARCVSVGLIRGRFPDTPISGLRRRGYFAAMHPATP